MINAQCAKTNSSDQEDVPSASLEIGRSVVSIINDSQSGILLGKIGYYINDRTSNTRMGSPMAFATMWFVEAKTGKLFGID